MNKNFKVFIFFLTLFLLPLKLPAQDKSPFGDTNAAISMDLQDASLKDVLKMLSIQSGLNFIASESLEDRKITLFLDKVPVKDAVDKLFSANNLSCELDEAAKIFIVKDWGRPGVETVTKVFYLKYATVSSSALMTEMSHRTSSSGTSGGGGTGSTGTSGGGKGGSSGGGGSAGKGGSSGGGGSAGGGNTGITNAVKNNLSSNGTVVEDYRTNSLIVTDIPSRMPLIEKIIASLDLPVSQVMLEVEMLDVSKNTVDKIGFKFGDNPFTFIVPGNQRVKVFLGNMAYRSASIPGGAGAVAFGHTFAEVLDFLRTSTDTKYLARPRLLTLNNETAEISLTKDEVVGRIDTVNTTSSGTTTTSEFIRATELNLTQEGVGIFLRVTPQINPDTNEITMVINPKSSVTTQSPLSTSGNLQSDTEVRSTKSTVKVHDGETVILGGLLHREKTETIRKLPFFGDLPLVGSFFRHKDVSKDLERELIIIITPHIVKDKNVELAQAKKTSLLTKEQITVSSSNRQLAIDSSLNSFEKVK